MSSQPRCPHCRHFVFDFAETFAHDLHIIGTLRTAAAVGSRLDAAATSPRETDVVSLDSYEHEPIQRLLVHDIVTRAPLTPREQYALAMSGESEVA